jgi:hypothetical protein
MDFKIKKDEIVNQIKDLETNKDLKNYFNQAKSSLLTRLDIQIKSFKNMPANALKDTEKDYLNFLIDSKDKIERIREK